MGLEAKIKTGEEEYWMGTEADVVSVLEILL